MLSPNLPDAGSAGDPRLQPAEFPSSPVGKAVEGPEAPAKERVLCGAVVSAGCPDALVEIGGLTVIERTILALTRASVARIVVVHSGERGVDEARSRTAPRAPGVQWISDGEASTGPWQTALEESRGRTLVLTEPVILDTSALESLGEMKPQGDAPGLRLTGGNAGPQAVSGFLLFEGSGRVIADLVAGTPKERARSIVGTWPIVSVKTGVFQPCRGPVQSRVAETELLKSLTKETDGFFAKWIDRKISRRLSSWLVRTRVTPNQITLLTLITALAGAALLALPGRLWSGVGALLFWSSTVLDGCDGEVARLKYLDSASGARLDILCDNASLIALFIAILVHVRLQFQRASDPYLAAAIVTGILGCMVSEYFLILRPRIEGRSARTADLEGVGSRRVLWYERLASRDFAYVLPFLAFGGMLRWLVWAAAVGVNVFWVLLLTVVARPGASRQAFRQASPNAARPFAPAPSSSAGSDA